MGAHNAQGVVERSIREIRKLFNLTYSGLRLDILSYETAFAWIANELNSLPICLGSRYQGLEHTDLITPSRLLLGRNNRRSPTGYARISPPSRLLDQLDSVYKAWWNVWSQEKIADYIPQPSKWTRSSAPPAVGDLVVFLKTDKEDALGDTLWRMGRIIAITESVDGIPRKVEIEYRNPEEKVFRTTIRSVRKVALIHREGDLELVDILNEASRLATTSFLSRL